MFLPNQTMRAKRMEGILLGTCIVILSLIKEYNLYNMELKHDKDKEKYHSGAIIPHYSAGK